MPLDPEIESELARQREGERLGAGYQAEVTRVRLAQGSVAVKRPRSGWLSGPLARAAVRREAQAYAHLAGVTGIPRLHGLTADGALVVDFIEGRSLRDAQYELADRERFFSRLLDTLRAMHAAGVAHGDLKRKDNILVGPGEQPYLIDFGIARIRGRSFVDDLLFGFTSQLDLNAWIKLKHGGRPAELSAGDAEIYRPLLIERIARWLRIPWQKLTLRRPRQRLRRWLESRRGR